MKAKKILAGVCASVMLAATAIPVVSAADSVKVTVGTAKAKAGATFSVKVDLADIPAAGINGCDFGIKYDSSVISITNVEQGEIAKNDTDSLDGVKSLEANVENGFVSIVYAVSGTSITQSGTFVTLTGKVNANATEGAKSELKIVAIDRSAKPTGTEVNSEYIFGFLKDDNKTFVNYDPTITNGWVEVEGETSTTPTEAPTTTEAPVTTTEVVTTTQAPVTTTEAPVTTTQAPVITPAPDVTTTQAPVITPAPDVTTTTQAPVITPAPDVTTTQARVTEPGGNENPATDVKATLLGDVDLNSVVELNDIVVLAKYLLSPTANPLNAQQKANADVNKDGKVDVLDLAKLIEHNLDPSGVPLN